MAAIRVGRFVFFAELGRNRCRRPADSVPSSLCRYHNTRNRVCEWLGGTNKGREMGLPVAFIFLRRFATQEPTCRRS